MITPLQPDQWTPISFSELCLSKGILLTRKRGLHLPSFCLDDLFVTRYRYQWVVTNHMIHVESYSPIERRRWLNATQGTMRSGLSMLLHCPHSGFVTTYTSKISLEISRDDGSAQVLSLRCGNSINMLLE